MKKLSILTDPSRVRVVVNGTHAKTGGGVTYLRNVLPLLADDPTLELHLFIHRDQYPLFEALGDRIRIHLLSFNPSLFSLMLWEQTALPLLAAAIGGDVLFSPANFGPLFARNSVILLRNSLAVVRGEARLQRRLYWAGLALFTFLSVLLSSRAIAVSQYALRALGFGAIGRWRRNIVVIPHGVGPSFSPPAAGKRRQEFLLVVADIYIQKNIHTLVKAVALLVNKHPSIEVRVAGRKVDESYYDEIVREVRELRLERHIRFLGSLETDELLRLYRGCRLMVFPSSVETFGHPLVEAMACGAPIASSDRAAMPEILGNAGLFFDPLDAVDMAEKVDRLLTDENLRETLSTRGLQRSRMFSLTSTARRTAEELKAVARRQLTRISS